MHSPIIKRVIVCTVFAVTAAYALLSDASAAPMRVAERDGYAASYLIGRPRFAIPQTSLVASSFFSSTVQ